MVLACDQPDEARHFYRQILGTPPECADFVAADGSDPSAPQWELEVGVDDPHHVVGRVHGQRQDVSRWFDETGSPVARISSPEGLTLLVRRVSR